MNEPKTPAHPSELVYVAKVSLCDYVSIELLHHTAVTNNHVTFL